MNWQIHYATKLTFGIENCLHIIERYDCIEETKHCSVLEYNAPLLNRPIFSLFSSYSMKNSSNERWIPHSYTNGGRINAISHKIIMSKFRSEKIIKGLNDNLLKLKYSQLLYQKDL